MPYTVAYQGERGAYSEAAARRHLPERGLDPDAATYRPCRTFENALSGLGDDVDLAVLPIENATTGLVAEVADLLFEAEPWIVGEVDLPIRHALIAAPGTGIDDVDRVLSHPQALAQCRRFLRDRGMEALPVHDTAGAVRLVAEGDQGPGAAAIASTLAAEIHGMEVLAVPVQDEADNRTRFLVLQADRDEIPDDAGKTTIGFVTDHSPGALHRALGAFAERQVNLLQLTSRPVPDRSWQYGFFADVEGGMDDPAVRGALQDLEDQVRRVWRFGSYPPASARDAGGKG